MQIFLIASNIRIAKIFIDGYNATSGCREGNDATGCIFGVLKAYDIFLLITVLILALVTILNYLAVKFIRGKVSDKDASTVAVFLACGFASMLLAEHQYILSMLVD